MISQADGSTRTVTVVAPGAASSNKSDSSSNGILTMGMAVGGSIIVAAIIAIAILVTVRRRSSKKKEDEIKDRFYIRTRADYVKPPSPDLPAPHTIMIPMASASPLPRDRGSPTPYHQTDRTSPSPEPIRKIPSPSDMSDRKVGQGKPSLTEKQLLQRDWEMQYGYLDAKGSEWSRYERKGEKEASAMVNVLRSHSRYDTEDPSVERGSSRYDVRGERAMVEVGEMASASRLDRDEGDEVETRPSYHHERKRAQSVGRSSSRPDERERADSLRERSESRYDRRTVRGISLERRTTQNDIKKEKAMVEVGGRSSTRYDSKRERGQSVMGRNDSRHDVKGERSVKGMVQNVLQQETDRRLTVELNDTAPPPYNFSPYRDS
ncbi:hypothetical protein HDU67_000510 [Dinochytrium kinnereticum]|nr:hypothetical protein HDU67_000510 [Dinochytrium kinnereticum]